MARWAASGLVFSPKNPNRRATRNTCVSTGSAGRPSENAKTQAAVFGPTPGSDVR